MVTTTPPVIPTEEATSLTRSEVQATLDAAVNASATVFGAQTQTAIAQIPTNTASVTATHTPTASATQTATFTPTETEAPTETRTSTATFTATPPPTETFTATPDHLMAVVTAQNLNIRNGPGEEFDVVGHLQQGDSVPVVGVNKTNQWLLVEYAGFQGWLAVEFVELTGPITRAPRTEPTPLPEFVRIDGFTHIWQQFNNCAPTVVTMALTYYGGPADTNPATRYLRPNEGRDVSVDIADMVAFVNDEFQGVRSVWRAGGNWTTIRRLVAAGFPVIIETGLTVNDPRPSWAGHNRLVIGYDGDDILTLDSFLGSGNGEGYRIEQSVIDELWRQQNRNYMVLYAAAREPEVIYIMGQNWSSQASVEASHRVALAEMAANPSNVFAQHNLGESFVALGDYQAAAEAFDAALDIGIPFRLFWYHFGIFEAYYNVGRYNEVVDMARRSLDSMSGNGAEELYYWLGMGYAGRGQLNLAKEQLERAIAFKPDYQPAITALEQIISGTYQPPV
jgi:hypothetical protein